MSNQDDFVIENGVLTKYRGDGGDVVIPDGVTGIGRSAFEDCKSLTSVMIPESVTSIGIDAFYDCSSLMSITIPAGVMSIGERAFEYCRGLADQNGMVIVKGILFNYFGEGGDVVIPAGVTSIGHQAFSYRSSLTSVMIPAGVTNIGDEAFWDCSSLTSVTIPDGVTSIGERAFNGCSSLTSVTIPESVTSIGEWTFGNCGRLTEINVDPANETYCSADGVLYNKAQAELLFCPIRKTGELVIIEGVTSIGEGALSDCSLTSVTIPASVTSIGDEAFQWCGGLTSITIPAGVTSIGENAFSGCKSLTSITIPDSVTSIGDEAFSGCWDLTSITIHDRAIDFGDRVFGDTEVTNFTLLVDEDSDTGLDYSEIGFWLSSELELLTITHWKERHNELLEDYCIDISAIVTDEIDAVPEERRPAAAVGYALHPDTDPASARAKCHFRYMEENAGALCELAFEHPELLRLLCDHRLIPAGDTDAYLAEAENRDDTKGKLLLLDYQNSLGREALEKARENEFEIGDFIGEGAEE